MAVPASSHVVPAGVLGARLREAGLTLATAESITAGGVVSALAAVDGSADWLRGGVVAYASAVVHAVLGVRAGPVVDREAAIEMAVGAMRVLNADVAIATTGCSGPESFEGHPPGTVWIAVAIGDDVDAREFRFGGDPAAVCRDTIEAAITYASSRLDYAHPTPSADAIDSRANLLPEEKAAGSDDPHRQAEVILEESSARVLGNREQSDPLERRTSADTVEPPGLG
jgi:nicotinamide-nucleotide amidase